MSRHQKSAQKSLKGSIRVLYPRGCGAQLSGYRLPISLRVHPVFNFFSVLVLRVVSPSVALLYLLGYKVFAFIRRQRSRQKKVITFRCTQSIPKDFFVMPFALGLPSQAWLSFSSSTFDYAALRLRRKKRTATYYFCSPALSLRLRDSGRSPIFALRAARSPLSARVLVHTTTFVAATLRRLPFS